MQVAERAIEIWPDIEKYARETEMKKKSQIPTIASYTTAAEAVKNPLTLAEPHVFESIARLFKPFLKKYQMDWPMMVFLAGDL